MRSDNPEEAARHREALERARARVLKREQKRVGRYERKLALARRPEAVAKAKLRLKRARSRMLSVQIEGSYTK